MVQVITVVLGCFGGHHHGNKCTLLAKLHISSAVQYAMCLAWSPAGLHDRSIVTFDLLLAMTTVTCFLPTLLRSW